MFVSHHEFIKYRTRLLVIIKYTTSTNILFLHFYQSKQKNFAPPLFSLQLHPQKFPAG